MKVGFIGLGIMGESMALNIIQKHNDEVFVYDIDKSKIDLLVKDGGKEATSIEDMAKKVDVIISMVPNSNHVVSVYEEVQKNNKKDTICIDMSTISPKVSVEIANKIKALGCQFLDAPVVKSKPAAIKGELGIYVGGNKEIFEKVKTILSYMGKNIIHLGENGKGLVMKIAHNTLVAQIQNGVNEMLSLALSKGINIDDFVTAISYGGGQNFYLDSKNKAIKERDFTTAFSVENMNKDLNICLQMLNEDSKELGGVSNVVSVYDKAMKQNLGKEDFSATYKLFE